MGGVQALARPSFFERCAERRLIWWPEIGVGYYPVECGAEPYDLDYFERFRRQADTDIGRALMAARVEFVDHFHKGPLVDVGIGSGAFIDLRNDKARAIMTLGYDVNPLAKSWLHDRDLWCDPYKPSRRVSAISLWDVLEHIPDFPALLERVTQWVFVSLPVFKDCEHVLRSKHMRRDEHVWYFTATGLIAVMAWLGFECVEMSDIETRIGREDIGTFAFRRI